jgi:hypothetical protein
MPLGGGGFLWERTPGTRIANQGPLDSAQVNDETDNLLAGINAKVSLSGTGVMTGLQTLFGDGTAALHGATVQQVQKQIVTHSTAVAGTVDAIQITLSPASTTWTLNETVRWKSGGANTITAPTISKDAGGTTKIIKKGASAALAVGDLGASGYECEGIYNGTDVILKNPATSATAATAVEQMTGTSNSVFSTPLSVAPLWKKGANLASAGTATFLDDGGFVHITGTTTITDLDFTTAIDGRGVKVIFDGILTLTHNGTTLQLPGNANITTAAGDRAEFVQDSSDNIICLWYTKADGTSVTAATGMTLITTLTTTSGTLHSVTSGILSSYRQLYFEIVGVSFTASATLSVAISTSGGSAYGAAVAVSAVSGAAGNTFDGAFSISAIQLAPATTSASVINPIYTVTSAGSNFTTVNFVLRDAAAATVNAVQFSGGTFDAGSIRVYGIR